MSETKKGNKNCLGRIISEETRAKIRQSNSGKKITYEHKLKLSLSKQKLILNTNTGIFYFGLKEVSELINTDTTTIGRKLRGKMKNNTSFIYV